MMKTQYFWQILSLVMLLCGCVEEAVLDTLDEPTGITQAEVRDNSVALSSDLSELCYYDDMQEQGFVVKTFAPNPAKPSEKKTYIDTIRVAGDLACTLEEDLYSGYEMEAFAYIRTSKHKIRSKSVKFRPHSGLKPEVTGMHIYSDPDCDYKGCITLYGKHLTRIAYQAELAITSPTYGGQVQFYPRVCTHDSIRFDYSCCNIGEFTLRATIMHTSFDLSEPLRVAHASLEAIDKVVYVGIPHRMDIGLKNSEIASMSCIVDKYLTTTRSDLMNDGLWRTVFMGKVGEKHQVKLWYTDRSGAEIYFPPFEVTYQSAWEKVGEATVVPPQCVIGGYGWSLKGGRNDLSHRVKLERLDFATGNVSVIESPCHAGEDDVEHLLGYDRDYCAFGDLTGDKVYCAAFIGLVGGDPDDYYETFYGKEVIRLFEYDITSGEWTKLFDLPAYGHESSNGYQTWAKVGDRFYFVNYVKGEVGYWDRATDELWMDSRDVLKDYYNDYCGYDSEYFYRLGNDMQALSMSDLSRKTIITDYIYEHFNTPEGEAYGVSRVIDGIVYNGKLMCSAPIRDYANRTYYGMPDGFSGGTLLPVGDDMYMIASSGTYTSGVLWRNRGAAL